MTRFYKIAIISFFLILFTGCGDNNATKQDIDYDQTKNMVVDILQTEDGKKALQEIIADDKMKQHLVMESEVVKNSITEALVSEQGAKMWQNLFEDPTFVESFNKSMEEEQKKLFKSLMNDSEFQKQMLELLQDPEMSKQTLTLIKSQEFRKHLEETIQQTLETPTFQARMQDVLLKAAEKQQQSQGGGGEGGGGQEGGGEGGEGGGEGGGEDGGEGEGEGGGG
ncbi:spore germination lipoprotein GerD [Pseudogracilibacillus sp. SO30301A]|uniref:spore germination lipoprotein GerD n=1 Tax=Pseudogracilibacillus sp. SO30301A TaxID=3098291 RepID=UPI00300E23DF